jgi:mannose/cellobiose epimerase-like protein (N-acyl-D-glucosamine 2-epimerase family)
VDLTEIGRRLIGGINWLRMVYNVGLWYKVLPPESSFYKTSSGEGKLAAHHLPALCRIKFFEVKAIVSN